MKKRFVACALALSTIICTPARADDAPLHLAPAAGWTAEFADNFCALRSSYSAGEHSVFLELKQFLPGRGFVVTLASQTLDRRDRNFRAAFLPDDEPDHPSSYKRVETDDGWEGYVYRDSLEPNGVESFLPGSTEAAARDSAITGYLIENGFASDFVLETGPLDEVMQVMRQCSDGLLESFGLDPERQRTLTRRVDYPAGGGWLRALHRAMGEPRAMRNEFAAVLLVGADGRVTGCLPYETTVDEESSEAACTYLIEDVAFVPALDRDGEATPSYLDFQAAIIRN